ncbi:MAG TPA: tripartite tricarboxylate transporter substrate binding protein [Burkholderiales bacterium]|nr:tripartite tricarboxylate transporter substrate binding protein [Burkholderiales bacterium]
MKTLVLWLIGAAMATPALAQNYPVRPVRVIVPVATGGGTDFLARAVCRELSERMGRQFVVDNRAGAGGAIGGDTVAKATPDGYTLIMGYTASHGINPALQKLPYDPVRDFTPISQVASATNMLVVHPSVPVKTVKELIAYAKAKPGQLRYASAGTGTAPHMSGELFDLMAGTKMIHVPYKGAGPALIDVLAGHVELTFTSLPAGLPHVKAGKVRPIAVTSLKRATLMPDLPTISESGLKGFDTDQWYGLLGPAKLPQPIVTKLHTETVAALKDEDLRKQVINQGFEIVGSTPEQFRAFIQSEVKKWAELVKKAGIKAET